MKLACIVLAAGSSSRMGAENKLLLPVQGESFIRRTVREICALGLSQVVIVTGHQAEQVQSEFADFPVQVVRNTRYSEGMHTSIRCGVQSLDKNIDGFYVCLSDQPYFSAKNLSLLAEFFKESKGSLFAPVFNGKRGHPVLISAKYVPEILAEPDGDYGCAYLFKRHVDEVVLVEASADDVLKDVDTIEDYMKVHKQSLSRDMVQNFYSRTLELRRSDKPFAIATIIEVIGSASARLGDKALFNDAGENVLGYVGGGCAERFVAEEALAAMKEGKPRTVLADLDDEILGLGVACGGQMKVFIDPQLPPEEVPTFKPTKFNKVMEELVGLYGWKTTEKEYSKEPDHIEDLFLALAHDVASKRQRTGDSLRHAKLVPASFVGRSSGTSKKVAIVGRSRITESLSRHFDLMQYEVRTLNNQIHNAQFDENEIVIIASHTKQDPSLVKRAIESGAAHVAMVGSKKRSLEVLKHLNVLDQEVVAPLYVPAGLDIEAKNPNEIALSIVAEIIKERGSNSERRS